MPAKKVSVAGGDTFLVLASSPRIAGRQGGRQAQPLPLASVSPSPSVSPCELTIVSTRTLPCRPSGPADPPSHTAPAADTAGIFRPGCGADIPGCSGACRDRRDRPARTVPSGDSGPSFSALSMSRAEATPSISMKNASFPIEALTRVVMKPGDSRTTTVSLPIWRATASTVSQRLRARLKRPHDLDQLHAVHRIEEVHACHACGSSRRPAISVMLSADVLVDTTASAGACAVDLGHQRELQIDPFRRRFDDKVRARERRGQVGGAWSGARGWRLRRPPTPCRARRPS